MYKIKNKRNIRKKSSKQDYPRFLDSRKEKVQYLESLVTKQLDLYNWCEEKVSTLATIDSILLGAATLFIEKVIVSTEPITICTAISNVIIIGLVLVPLFISLSIALWHIRPKMGKTSNTGRPNHRSSNGIRHFHDANEYEELFTKLSDKELYEDLSKQIYGMNTNIWKNQRSIKIAVMWDLIGLVGFLIMIIYWAI